MTRLLSMASPEKIASIKTTVSAGNPKEVEIDTAPESEKIVGSSTQKTEQPAGALEKKESEKVQEWLDQKREASFVEYAEYARDLLLEGGDDAVQKWFIDMFQPALKSVGREALTIEDVNSLVIGLIKSESASRIAGTSIERPIMMFTDFSQFSKFQEKVFGKTGAGGMILAGENFIEGTFLRDTGLVIGTRNVSFTDHEILHSIDPHVGTREGVNNILTEAFAFYEEVIASKETLLESNWLSFMRRLSDESYYVAAQERGDTDTTLEGYQATVNTVVKAIKSLTERYGHTKTQRILVQTKTIEELLNR